MKIMTKRREKKWAHDNEEAGRTLGMSEPRSPGERVRDKRAVGCGFGL